MMETIQVLTLNPPKARVTELTLGWNVAMNRAPKIELCSISSVIRAPQALTVKISPPNIPVSSFYFGDPAELCKPNEKKEGEKNSGENGGENGGLNGEKDGKKSGNPSESDENSADSQGFLPEDAQLPWDENAPGSAQDEEDACEKERPCGNRNPENFNEGELLPDGASPDSLDLPEGENAEDAGNIEGSDSDGTGGLNGAEGLENAENAGDSGSMTLQQSVPESLTHLLPPKNLIKLEDRLRYLLQPPLEQLYTDKNLVFPFVPFHYQWEGVSFLYSRDAAILADEMGLGKTMQAITTVRLLLRNGDIRNVLFVCPKPLVTNWKREFEVWAPEIPAIIIQGDRVRREWQWGLQDIPVKIANYELLHRDRDIYAPKKGIPKHFDLVVLDESQKIKNVRSATSVAARSISRSRNWALTGTPIENSPDDLVGIFEFLYPGFLSNDMKPTVMGRAVQDYILRRTKDVVQKDMPPRLYRDAELFMTAEQQETYSMAESQGAVRLSEMGESITIQHVFELVLRLKQICNFDPCTGDSPKLQRLEADLEEIAASGRKAIVFSQWTETIFRLKKHLERFGALEYHGKIPASHRDAVIQKFKNTPESHVLLMSYATGAVGLNLQFCNYVFLFDRWWNPAVEDQAINRAHRIGVKGAVTITRFLMLNTIEERINRILEEKRALFETILSGSREQPKKLGLTQDEVFGLFKLKSPKGAIHRF